MLNFGIFKPKEKFLLLQIEPQKTSAALLSLDEEKNLTPEKFWEKFSFDKFSRNPLKVLDKRKIIVGAHPAFVATILSPVCLERVKEEASNSLGIVELENLFSKEIGKIFNQHRKTASARLGIEEIDTVLVGVKASDFKIDRHVVVNPLGFRGKDIDALLELTFTTRQIFEDLKDFFKSRDGFFFKSSGGASLFALSRVRPLPLSSLLIGQEGTVYAGLDKVVWGKALKEEKIPWSLNSLFKEISSAFDVSPEVTLEIYYKHVKGELSDRLHGSLRRILKPVFDKLLTEIKKIGHKGSIHVYSPVPLPANLRADRAFLEEMPLEDVLNKLGFKLNLPEWPMEKSAIFMLLAPFWESYFDKSDSEINQKLRRRLHWLIQ